MWGRKLAGQAPIAVEQIKQVSHKGDLDEGIEAEKEGFATAFAQRGRQGGHRRLPRQAHPEVERQVADERRRARVARAISPSAESQLAELIRESRSAVALTGAGVSVPSGIPDFRTPGDRAVGERRPDGGRPHRRLRARPGALLVLLPAALPVARRQAAQRAHTRRWPSSSGAACSRRHHAEHRSPASAPRAPRTWSRSTARSRPRAARALRRRATGSSEVDALFDEDGIAVCAAAAGRSNPTSSSSARCCRRAAMARAQELGRRRRADALRRLLARGLPGRRPARADARARRRAGNRHQGADALRRRRRAQARRRGRRGADALLAALR